MTQESDIEALRATVERLERELEEATETLDAIRNGEVDAVVVGGPAGQVVYTLENADRPYRVLVEQMREGAVTLDAAGAILYCNRSFARLVGERYGAVIGRSLFDYVPDAEALGRLLKLSATGESAELSLRAADGGVLPVNLSLVELRVEDGAPRMLSAVLIDLSENYRRAAELAAANRALSAEVAERTRVEQSLTIALEAADMGAWELNLDTDSATRSPRHDAIFGLDPPPPTWGLADALRRFVPEDREAVERAFRAAAKAGSLDFEARIRRDSDGAVRWLHVRGRAVEGSAPARRLTGVVLDTTETRLVAEQLRQAQKMDAIGQLTGGIAHDFNNLLMIIGGSLQALSRRVTLGEREQRLLDGAQQGVARGATLNAQLLAFARRQDMRVEAICINDLLPTFEILLDRAVGETVRVELRPVDELWHCSTDPHQLETAILNLAINARDAMPAGGTVTLTTRNAAVNEAEARRWEALAGDYAAVAIADTGSGMSAELLAHVFEPFFTTKGVGKGTGLGLSQVYGFAKQSGGFVAIESASGQGTTVSIYLPRVAAAPRPAEADAPRATEAAASGTVLLVEDDADVRAASRAMLEELGYCVREAEGAQAALDSLGEDPVVDCVFSDVVMSSGMNGFELAQTLKARHPGLPVLLNSGYTAQRLAPRDADAAAPLLHKPFTLDELSEGLRRAMRGTVAAPAGE